MKPQFTGTPIGNVTFSDGTRLKTVALGAGVAKYTTTKLAAGEHKITATYIGRISFDSGADSLTQMVN